MDLSRIISISGKPGLYRLISQTRGGFVVEDLEKRKKISITSNYNVSLLENVAIYGISEEFPLSEVFSRIYKKEDGGTSIDHKISGAELRNYIKEVLPEYDETRVYDSDLKKLFQWYNILQSNGLLKIDLTPSEEALKEDEEKKVTPKKVVSKKKKESK